MGWSIHPHKQMANMFQQVPKYIYLTILAMLLEMSRLKLVNQMRNTHVQNSLKQTKIDV